MDIVLRPDLERFVQERITGGRYCSASGVVNEALVLLRERDRPRQALIEELRREGALGMTAAERGETATLDMAAIKASGRRRLMEQQED